MFRNQDRFFKGAPETPFIVWNGETTDEEINRLLFATTPDHTRWESHHECMSKIKYRDELIRGLQACLNAVQNERNLLIHKYETPNKD